MRALFTSLSAGIAGILYLDGWLAVAMVSAILLTNPAAAAAGLLAVVTAVWVGLVLGTRREPIPAALIYNPLLLGLALGCRFEWTWSSAAYIALAGLCCGMLTRLLIPLFSAHFKLPILSLPFVFCCGVLLVAAERYQASLAPAEHLNWLAAYDLELPRWLSGYLRALSAILFSPSHLGGVLLACLIFRISRILFFLSVLGYLVGTEFRALLLDSRPQAYADLLHFNFILTAMALGGVFLVPSLKGYFFAALSVCAMVPLMDAVGRLESGLGVQVYNLPYNLMTLGMLYVLGVSKSPMLVSVTARTPEETLDNHLCNLFRYRGHWNTLFLPFSGQWTVWQAFDGPWTHQGALRYAYDFVIEGADKKTYQGEGSRVEDYHAFKKPVLSPVGGTVLRVVENLPDNPPGMLDETNNWGNLVVLKDPRGFVVKLCHFAEKSIAVKEGQWVERGQLLGLCGNSGYSPQPHLHLQISTYDLPDSPTLPFSFVSYLHGQSFCSNDTPPCGTRVEPLYPDKTMDARTAFVLDSRFEFEAQYANRKSERLELVVKMAADGTHYLQSDRGRLYFGRHEGTFYFYRVEGNDERLRVLFLALPRLPLAAREGLIWKDYVPVGVATRGVKCALIRFLGSFYPELARVTVTQQYTGAGRIVSRCHSKILGLNSMAEIELDERLGFSKVSAGSWVLRRINSTSREQEKGHEQIGNAGRAVGAGAGRVSAMALPVESLHARRRVV